MANRHLSRSIALQSLFEWDFSGKPENIKSVVDRNIAEFASGHDDIAFIYELVETVQRKQTVIDDIISKAAPEWPLEKISNVDRNVLRMGLAELLFGDRSQVPPKVAINESIELAKAFGGENSGRFVNGVLGAVYREMGEPEKDQLGKKTKDDFDPEKVVVEEKAGGLVYTQNEGEYMVALVHDVFGYWTLPKGSFEEGEDREAAAKRQMEDKLGIKIDTLKEEIGNIDYIASHPEKGKVRKLVTFFLAEAKHQNLNIYSDGGLDKAQWFKLSDVVDLTIYDDILPVIAKAIEIIKKG